MDYKVGSKDEKKGRTGFAHLFEHMMFKGSENVGPGELDFLIYTKGGNSNGTTNTDRTSYYETMPKNQLDLGIFSGGGPDARAGDREGESGESAAGGEGRAAFARR